jgi:hypothetical protein
VLERHPRPALDASTHNSGVIDASFMRSEEVSVPHSDDCRLVDLVIVDLLVDLSEAESIDKSTIENRQSPVSSELERRVGLRIGIDQCVLRVRNDISRTRRRPPQEPRSVFKSGCRRGQRRS